MATALESLLAHAKNLILRTRREVRADEAAKLLVGWDANDILTFDTDQWPAIPWKKFHAVAYRYKRSRDIQRGLVEVELWPDFDQPHKVYTSDKWMPFIQSMREAMWSLVNPAPTPNNGVVYIVLTGKPCRRRRWTIPLYDYDLFTPRA